MNQLVCRLLAGALVCSAVTISLVLPTHADRRAVPAVPEETAQSPTPGSRARLYVAAARDSRLFALCPPDGLRQQALLPWLIAGGPGADRSMERTELDAGLPAWDQRTAKAITGEVNGTGAFRVVESADDADLVLLVEAQYRTVASFSRRTEQSTQTITQIGWDREANVLGALFAILVPAEQYRRHGPNVSALLPTSVWNLSLIHISEPTRLGMISYA